MDEMDLTALLNVCLENAMEILRTLPPEEKRLSIMISAKYGILMVQTTNSVNQSSGEDFIVKDMALFSKCEEQKGEKPQYMSAIAKKYGGFADVQRKGKKFAALVFLCMCRPCEIE